MSGPAEQLKGNHGRRAAAQDPPGQENHQVPAADGGVTLPQTTDMPSGSTKSGASFVDVTLPKKHYVDVDFTNSKFIDAAAKGAKFTNCNFTACIFERAYFNEARFEKCKFFGARFLNSNFRNAIFTGNCRLDYTFFHHTWIEADQVASNMPGYTNVAHEFCQTMKANFRSVGDSESERLFFELELDYESDYLREAAQQRSAFFQKPKYESKWPVRADYWFRYYSHAASDSLWGHGIKPLRFLRVLALSLSAAAILVFASAPSFGMTVDYSLTAQWLHGGAQSILYVLAIFLGLPSKFGPTTVATTGLALFIRGLGYVSLGLMVAMVYRRLARH